MERNITVQEKFERVVQYLEARRRQIKASLEAMVAKFCEEAKVGPWNLAGHLKWKADEFLKLGAEQRVLEFHLGNAVAHFLESTADWSERWRGLCRWFKVDFERECLRRLAMNIHQSTNPMDNLKEQLEDQAHGEARESWHNEFFYHEGAVVDEAMRGDKLKLLVDQARELVGAVSALNAVGGIKSSKSTRPEANMTLSHSQNLRRLLDRFYPEAKPAELTDAEMAAEAAKRG